ncbi:hypothetical protein [Candidatus Hodarchaeum mangrovi]
MKKLLGSQFNRLFIIFIILSMIIALNSNINLQVDESTQPRIQMKTNEFNLEDLHFFDVRNFDSTSHTINVSRVIRANEYGYTTSRTELRIFNNDSNIINAINLTLPIHEYDDSKFIKIFSSNDTEEQQTEWQSFLGNDSCTITIKFPDIDTGENTILVIVMDHLNAVSFDKNNQLAETAYPYHFNMSFIPLISIPITKYDIDWKVGTEIEVKIKNETILPRKSNYTGSSIQSTQGIVFNNITEITGINRTILNSSDYNYDMVALENKSFIPAFSPSLAQNLSLYLSFDYYQFAETKIEFSQLKTTIEMSEWGYVYTKHEILIKNIGLKSGPVLSTNLGGPTFNTIGFYLPRYAGKIGMHDNYGNLTPSVVFDSVLQKKSLEVYPRIEIEQDAEYHLYLSYREPVSELVKDRGGGKVRLSIPLSMNFNWTVREFELNIFVPHGSSYSRQKFVETIETATLRQATLNKSIQKRELGIGFGIFNKPGVQINFTDITPLSNKIINIDFGLDPFVFFKVPLSISFFFLSLGIIYALARNLSFGLRPRGIVIEEIPLDLIREFVKSYEEKTALREQIIRLDKKRKSKNISAREFEQTRTILLNRQQRMDRALVNVSSKLSDEGTKYRVSMRSIEVAEANREAILLNIDSLEKKKTQGRIGKEAYAKLKLNYDKQLRKANNDIDKVLIELRSLLTK